MYYLYVGQGVRGYLSIYVCRQSSMLHYLGISTPGRRSGTGFLFPGLKVVHREPEA